MTTYTQSTLKTFFQTNDVPSGTDYANFIDSCVNVAETSAQSMAGPLSPTELITPRVSATNAVITGTLRIGGITSASSLYIDTLVYASAAQFTGTVSAANFNAANGRVTASAATFTADVSASTGTVYASAVRSTNGVLSGSGTVSAAGITQGAAAILTNVINRGKGVVDGVTTGFAPLANRAGLVQYLLNEGVSANLWPPTGGFINGLAVNTPFPLVTSAAYTIFHITASSYGVK
jgi:hypothetical protein